jgi:hypothetical protein
MQWKNTEVPTFAGSGGSSPAVVETLELLDRDGNVLKTFTKDVAGLLVESVGGMDFSSAGEIDALAETDLVPVVQVVAAVAPSGSYQFGANPTDGDTINFNGVVFTFKDTPEASNDIEIEASAGVGDTNLGVTIDNLLTALNASTDARVSGATYSDNHTSTNKDGDTVTITSDTTGPSGNAYKLLTSTANIERSDLTLTGGADAFNQNKFVTVADLAAAVNAILNP